jgi:hypothetical protein
LFKHRRYSAASEKIRNVFRTFGAAQAQDARRSGDFDQGVRSGAILTEQSEVSHKQVDPAEQTTMTDKTKTVVVIEHHEQTIIRRSRRTMSSGEVPIALEPGALGQPLAMAQAEPVVREKRQSLGACLKTVAIKGAPWLRRMTARVNERKNRLS